MVSDAGRPHGARAAARRARPRRRARRPSSARSSSNNGKRLRAICGRHTMTDPSKKTVLLTGGTGFVGGCCRDAWGAKYNLRIADSRPMEQAKDRSRKEGGGNQKLALHESFVLLDITKYEQFLAACESGPSVVCDL